MSRKLLRQMSSPRPSVRRRAMAALGRMTETPALSSLAASAQSAADAASASAARLRSTLEQVQNVTGAVNTPNGTTRKIARIVADGLATA